MGIGIGPYVGLSYCPPSVKLKPGNGFTLFGTVPSISGCTNPIVGLFTEAPHVPDDAPGAVQPYSSVLVLPLHDPHPAVVIAPSNVPAMPESTITKSTASKPSY